MVPSPAVFYELFQLEEGKKAWKQKKIPLDDFENITGGLYASVSFMRVRCGWTGANLVVDPLWNFEGC